MATILTSQLAQVAAKSSNSLDLKAQHLKHSQSLLFQAPIAAAQSFDSLFQICLEGYQELRRMDERFEPFAKTIFGEQSKSIDRMQMTTTQNQELDIILESFIRLVGSRLMLRPGLKALEWLIRRFRVHEYSTLCLTYAFLPYHNTPHFTGLLSILPRNLPKAVEFLRPYLEPSLNPPRIALVNAATKNPDFFTTWSKHILQTCREGCNYHPMTTYWATIIADSVLAQIDHGASRNQNARNKIEEEVLLRLLPILNEGLAMRKADDMRLCCFIIMTILASKASLQDNVLTAMMEATMSNRSRNTDHAELVCLVVLAQRRTSFELPKKITRAMISHRTIAQDLSIINKQYRVGKLCLGMLLGIAFHSKLGDEDLIVTLTTAVVELNLMTDEEMHLLLDELLRKDTSRGDHMQRTHDRRRKMKELLIRSLKLHEVERLEGADFGSSEVGAEELDQMGSPLPLDNGSSSITSSKTNAGGSSLAEEEQQQLNTLCEDLSSKVEPGNSFLSRAESDIFKQLLLGYRLAYNQPQKLKRFTELAVLRKSSAMKEPLFISFFICIWCGPHSSGLKASALEYVGSCIQEGTFSSVDLQLLVPYLFYALADASAEVRRAAVNLTTCLWVIYNQLSMKEETKEVLGKDDLYDTDASTNAFEWLPFTLVFTLFEKILVPNLEDFCLDGNYLSQIFNNYFGDAQLFPLRGSGKHDLKAPQKAALLGFFASHLLHTPLLKVKVFLLDLFTNVEEVGTASKSKVLAPVISDYERLSEEELHHFCAHESIDIMDFANNVLSIITPADGNCVNTLQHILQNSDPAAPCTLRKAVLVRVKQVWTSVKVNSRITLALMLFEFGMGVTTSDTTDRLQEFALETLWQLPLSADVLIGLLEHLPAITSNLSSESSPSKRRKINSDAISGHDVVQADKTNERESLRIITVMLELVQASRNTANTELLARLFDLLADLRHFKDPSLDASYSQMLLISCLADSIKKLKDLGIPVDRASVRADIIVDCFRNSTNSQVQNASLVLMSFLATSFPDLVIDSVMPIFTFMSSNMLQQADDYTAYVIEKTIDSLVPPLMLSLRNDKNGPLVGVSKLLLSFVAAYDHIPLHRRKQLFTSLVNKLGPNEYLATLLIMLVDRHGNDKPLIKFALDLSSQYNFMLALKVVNQCLEILIDVLSSKNSHFTRFLMLENGRSQEDTVNNLLSLPIQLLQSPGLVSTLDRALSRNSVAAQEIHALYSNTTKLLLDLMDLTATNEVLDQSCRDLFDVLLNLLSLPESIKSLRALIQNGTVSVRRRILRSLELRIGNLRPTQDSCHDACLDFLPTLASIAATTPDSLLQQIAITCIDRIADRFGKLRIQEVAEIGAFIAGEKCLGAADNQIRVVSLLCLATMVEVIGDSMIPAIPSAIRTSLDHIEQTLSESSPDEGLYKAVFSFLDALLLYLPWIMTRAHLERISRLSQVPSVLHLSRDCQRSRANTLELTAKQVDAQKVFSNLYRTWHSAVRAGPWVINEHLAVLQMAVNRHSKSVITRHTQILSALFLNLLDLRRLLLVEDTDYQYSKTEVSELESRICDIMVQTVYKLNDACFKPMFARMAEWAGKSDKGESGQEHDDRAASFFLFLSVFFGTLKSIVTNYASLILELTANILDNDVIVNIESSPLWTRVITALQAACEHDQEGFWQSPNNFTTISDPLLAQLGNVESDEQISALIPCITAFATASESTNNMKVINSSVLTHMRSESALVRFAAIKCEISLTTALGEEWLAFLPEMLPLISEAMEDDDEKVEREVSKWVQVIEKTLGESISSMLH